MLTIAELPSQPLEIKLAQIFIILENLKSTYAKKVGIPFYKGSYRLAGNPPRTNLRREPPLGFEALLKMMFNDVGMSPTLRRIVRLRNEIIHFGLSRKPYESLSRHYDYCQDIAREYLLRLMKYHGTYLLYSSASREQATL